LSFSKNTEALSKSQVRIYLIFIQEILQELLFEEKFDYIYFCRLA